MKIENLKYWLKVVEYGSINKAANNLFMTPQNLGGIMKKLEEELGVELFARSNKGILLTEEGKKFLPYARNIVKNYDEYFLCRNVVDDNKTINLYTTSVLGNDLALLQGTRIDKKFYLSIQKRSVSEMNEKIQAGSLDLFLLPIPIAEKHKYGENIKKKIIYSEQSYVVIGHKDNDVLKNSEEVLQEKIKKCLQIKHASNFYPLNKDNSLLMDSIPQCKNMMKFQNAVFYCGYSVYLKYFEKEDEWIVLQQVPYPEVEVTLLYSCEDKIAEEISLLLKRV